MSYYLYYDLFSYINCRSVWGFYEQSGMKLRDESGIRIYGYLVGGCSW